MEACKCECVCVCLCVRQANEENIRGNQMEYIFRELIDINSRIYYICPEKNELRIDNGVQGSSSPIQGFRWRKYFRFNDHWLAKEPKSEELAIKVTL